MIEDAQRVPFIFVSNNYGDHPITKPLQSLDALLLRMMPVTTQDAKGVQDERAASAAAGARGASATSRPRPAATR
jgi:hypothetical protein